MIVRHLVLSHTFAGVERHVAVLANEQVRRGHNVEVWGGNALTNSHLLDPRIRLVTVHRLSSAVLEGLRRPSPTVLHAHMTKAETAALPAKLFRGVPLVVTRHFAAIRGASVLGGVARPVIDRLVAAQIAISEYVAAEIGGESTVIYPGVPSTDPPSSRREPVVVVVQRLEREKDTPTAIRAFAAGAPREWTLEVVGDGAERPALEALARSLNVGDRVHFRGFQGDVMTGLRRASVLLAPCPVEGLGLAVLEAMSCSLPVVASHAGAHLETVGRAKGARLFAPGNWHQAAEQLGALCASPELIRTYGAELQHVQQAWFTPERQADETDRLYQKVYG